MLNSNALTTVSMVALLAAATGCEDKARPATEAPSSASASSISEANASPASEGNVREGKWEANAPGRGVAYTVESKGGMVTLNMGGTLFEGTPHGDGRAYKTHAREYVVSPTSDGFELRTQGKPTWRVVLAPDSVVLTAEEKKLTLTKVGESVEVRNGNELIGKVRTEGSKVKVTDASGTEKWNGTDGLVGAWGVLLMKDIGQPMQRLLFTELLARGR